MNVKGGRQEPAAREPGPAAQEPEPAAALPSPEAPAGDDPGQAFHDVVVVPFQELMDSPLGGAEHRGGPLWPGWDAQVAARHRRHGAPIDVPPVAPPQVLAHLPSLAWCGPLVPHFGHQIADFSMRIMPTLVGRPDLPLAFSSKPTWEMTSWEKTKPFFREILDWFEIPPERIVLINEPTLVDELIVFGQAEQLGGPGPNQAILDRLDEHTARRFGGPVPRTMGTAYVSRSDQVGRLAGELHLEHALRRAGVTILHPGSHQAVTDEIREYHRCEHLIFAEGSAIHMLQLSGRIDADVSVIERRPGLRLAKDNIEPRARSLRYIQGSAGVVHGVRPDGQPALPTGVSVLDEEKAIEHLGRVGVDIRPHWDRAEFQRERDADVRDWLRRFLDSPRVGIPGGVDMVVETLRKTGVGHLAEEVVSEAGGRAVAVAVVARARESGDAAGAAASAGIGLAEGVAPPAVREPWAVRRLTRVAEGLGAKRYLELGVGEGSTFAHVAIDERAGVDRRLPRDRSALGGPGVRLEETSSTSFFRALAADEVFDLVYLHAVHPFEVVYRDLCSVLLHSHPRTAILVDSTRPVDAYASAPERQLAERLRNIDGSSSGAGAWQGDTFKLVFAIHDFHLGLAWRTMTSPGRSQTLVWRSRQATREPRLGSLEAVSRLTYFGMLEHWDVMQACTEDEGIGDCLAELGGAASRIQR